MVAGAKSYVLHMTPVGKTGQSSASIMFYSETPEFNIPADTTSRNVGDKVYVYMQAYPEVGQGSDGTAKAAWLNDTANKVKGSDWTTGVGVTIA